MRLYAIQITGLKQGKTSSVAYYLDREEKVLPYAEFEALKAISGPEYDMWETVTVRFAGVQYIMLVEESGKFKDLPINPIATALYANPFDAIAGDAWLVSFDGIEDLTYLEEYELQAYIRKTGQAVELKPLEKYIS